MPAGEEANGPPRQEDSLTEEGEAANGRTKPVATVRAAEDRAAAAIVCSLMVQTCACQSAESRRQLPRLSYQEEWLILSLPALWAALDVASNWSKRPAPETLENESNSSWTADSFVFRGPRRRRGG